METSRLFCYISLQHNWQWFNMSHWLFAVLLIFRHRIKCCVLFFFSTSSGKEGKWQKNYSSESKAFLKGIRKSERASSRPGCPAVALGLWWSCWFKHMNLNFCCQRWWHFQGIGMQFSDIRHALGRVWISVCKRSQ